MKVKVLTLNLHGWQESEQLEKFSVIANFIADSQIDVIAFQEVAQRKDSPHIEGQIRSDNAGHLILQELNQRSERHFTMHWDWSHYGWDVYEEGVAVLSRFPAVDDASEYVSVSLVNAEVVFEEEPVSDHFGVMMEIEW